MGCGTSTISDPNNNREVKQQKAKPQPVIQEKEKTEDQTEKNRDNGPDLRQEPEIQDVSSVCENLIA